MTKVYFRHESIREHQKKMVGDVYDAICARKHVLAHAPCGIGKTDAALAPAITCAVENGLNIFFLTPKLSQHKIAAEAVRGIAEKYGLKVRAADIIGRRHACANPALDGLDHDSFYQACERARKEGKCSFYTNAKGGDRQADAKAEIEFHRTLEGYGVVKHHSEFVAEAGERFLCPYEMMLKVAAVSNVIIADYFHILDPQIRARFLVKTKKKMENSIIILDEAHNLPGRVREHLSSSFNSAMAVRMDKEMRAVGLKLEFAKEFCEWASETLRGEPEALVEKEKFDSALAYFPMKPEEAADYFEAAGIAYMDKTEKKSALLKFSRFLRGWLAKDDGSSIRILKGRREFFTLARRSMDPSLVTSALNEAHSAVLMSATLHPMAMYRDLLGLDKGRTVMESYPSPFPESNRINLVVDGVTTKFSRRTEEEYVKIAGIIDSIHAGGAPSGRGTAVFFPSYGVMKCVLPLLSARPLHAQAEDSGPNEVGRIVRDFCERGGMLAGVQGGSLSEGLDFSNSEIKNAIIVGIALEEMGLEVQSLIDYYQKKFGKGWEYAYIYPAVVRALQSAGRAIRKETDRAAIIFLDERFSWGNYRRLLPEGESYTLVSPSGLSSSLSAFWARGHSDKPTGKPGIEYRKK